MLDKSIVARNFGRHAGQYTTRALVQEQVALDLLKCVPSMAFTQAVDLGCGPGVNFKALKTKAAQVVGVDLSAPMCALAQSLKLSDVLVKEGNIEELNLAPYDLIFSSLALQWCDVNKFWHNLSSSACGRVFLALAIPVEGTMAELGLILNEANLKGRVNNFPSSENLATLVQESLPLARADKNITLKCYTKRYISVYFDEVSYLNSVRGIGASSVLGQGALKRSEYAKFMAGLKDKLKQDGKLEHTYEVMFIEGYVSF